MGWDREGILGPARHLAPRGLGQGQMSGVERRQAEAMQFARLPDAPTSGRLGAWIVGWSKSNA